MKAIILFDTVHVVLNDGNPAFTVPVDQWTPVPRAVVDIPSHLKPYVKPGLPYDSIKKWFSATSLLAEVRAQHAVLFLSTFSTLDTKGQRASQDITARNVEIGQIDRDVAFVSGAAAEELSALKAKLHAANASDEQHLVSLRLIVDENRELLAELNAMAIPENATLEEVQAIVLRAIEIKPWLP